MNFLLFLLRDFRSDLSKPGSGQKNNANHKHPNDHQSRIESKGDQHLNPNPGSDLLKKFDLIDVSTP